MDFPALDSPTARASYPGGGALQLSPIARLGPRLASRARPPAQNFPRALRRTESSLSLSTPGPRPGSLARSRPVRSLRSPSRSAFSELSTPVIVMSSSSALGAIKALSLIHI